MLSFWEKNYLLSADVIIVGSGITGLSTACSIKEKSPETSVLVLEQGVLPTGASTKNAGFACIGSITEKMHDLKLMGEDAFLQLISDRWEGLHRLRKRLGDDRIDYQNNGGYELLSNAQVLDPDQLDEMNSLLQPVFNKHIFHIVNNRILSFGFKQVDQMIVNEVEGQINTGLMMHHLWSYASQLGVRILTGVSVQHFEETNSGVAVETNQTGINFTTRQLVLCTNAFTSAFLPEEDITPGRGQVLLTNEIADLPWKGVFNFDEGFYYFRNLGNRVLFGGGRNLELEHETTTNFEINPRIQTVLEQYLQHTILPGRTFQITDRWVGIMAFGKDKLPLVQRVSSRVLVGARLNGMGVALAGKIGDRLAAMLLEND